MSDSLHDHDPDPRARALARHLFTKTGRNCGSLKITVVDCKPAPPFRKTHLVTSDQGHEYSLNLDLKGNYGLYERDLHGEFTNVMEHGHIDKTPVGKQAVLDAIDISGQLTGENLQVKERVDFFGLGAGFHMVPEKLPYNHGFMLIDFGDGKYTLSREKQPSRDIAEFEGMPVVSTTRDEMDRNDLSFMVFLSIRNREKFEEILLGQKIENITSDDLVANLLIPGWAPVESGIGQVRCSDIEFNGSELAVKITAHVPDRKSLMANARSRYKTTCQDEFWIPATPQEALYEVLLASNANHDRNRTCFAIRAMNVVPHEISAKNTPSPDF